MTQRNKYAEELLAYFNGTNSVALDHFQNPKAVVVHVADAAIGTIMTGGDFDNAEMYNTIHVYVINQDSYLKHPIEHEAKVEELLFWVGLRVLSLLGEGLYTKPFTRKQLEVTISEYLSDLEAEEK